jgi:hypothetical protein
MREAPATRSRLTDSLPDRAGNGHACRLVRPTMGPDKIARRPGANCQVGAFMPIESEASTPSNDHDRAASSSTSHVSRTRDLQCFPWTTR